MKVKNYKNQGFSAGIIIIAILLWAYLGWGGQQKVKIEQKLDPSAMSDLTKIHRYDFTRDSAAYHGRGERDTLRIRSMGRNAANNLLRYDSTIIYEKWKSTTLIWYVPHDSLRVYVKIGYALNDSSRIMKKYDSISYSSKGTLVVWTLPETLNVPFIQYVFRHMQDSARDTTFIIGDSCKLFRSRY